LLSFIAFLESVWSQYSSTDFLSPSIPLTHTFLCKIHFLGYGRHVNALQEFLAQQQFASEIDFISKRDPSISGNFEVTIVETGELIHSKKRGNGLANSSNAKQAIAVRIEDALDNV
jgi:selT/selW/selH-like putative selenoprotein